jgi:glyoxylase-like metal-dependent hydrolase (beta-lactamase superfamily II)
VSSLRMRDLTLTRRRLLFHAGSGVLGVVLLNTVTGCSDSPDAAGPTPTTGAPPSATNTPPGSNTAAGQWQRVNLSFVSAYLLIRGNEAAVVDLGTSGSGAAIGSALQAAGSRWDAVRHVILTHHHGDHAGSVAEVAQQVNAAIYAGEADVASITSPTPLRPVKDNDDVFGLRIVGTPGHTAGHVAVFDPATGVLVTGDALRTSGGELTGPDPGFTADMTQATASVRKLAALDVKTIFPGHGDPITTNAAQALRTLADSLPR